MPERPMPPVIADVLRPHLSASKKAGTDIASMSIPDTPDARNDAVAEDSPAWENSMGAYYSVVSISMRTRQKYGGTSMTHIKHPVYSRELNHAQHEERQHRSRPVPSPEQDSKALPWSQADPLLRDRHAAHEARLSLDHGEVKPAQRIQGRGLVAAAHRPPGGLWQPGAQPDQHDRHDHHHDERQPPRHAGPAQVDTPVARKVADADPSGTHELRQAGQDAPVLGRRYLRDVDGHVAQVDALPQPGDRPSEEELREPVRGALEEGPGAEEHRAEEDGPEAAVVVGQPAGKDGGHRAGEHDERDGEADERGGEAADGGLELRH